MKPSHRWFPRDLVTQAAWMRNFAGQFASVGPGLGFSPAEIAEVEADAEAISWLSANQTAVEAFRRAAAEYRRHVLEGKPGSLPGTFPQPGSLTPPAGISVGIYKRIVRIVNRARAAPGFSAETAAALAIDPLRPADANLNDAKPNPGLKAEPGNVVIVRFVRGGFDGLDLQMKVDKEEAWTNAGRLLRSPGLINVPPGPENLPRAVQVRARFLVGNEAVGQYSDIDTISTIP
jgi:hypothetical protein